jgi:hypothetical protein
MFGWTPEGRDPRILYEVVGTLVHEAARELTKPACMGE